MENYILGYGALSSEIIKSITFITKGIAHENRWDSSWGELMSSRKMCEGRIFCDTVYDAYEKSEQNNKNA